MIGFDEHRGNTLIVEDGKLAGRVAEPILGREAKLATLLELRQRLGLAPHETLAAGDGANDLAMIEAAGLGVAYHAKPKVAEAAHARIDHGDLTALLYLQGYARADFVEHVPAEQQRADRQRIDQRGECEQIAPPAVRSRIRGSDRMPPARTRRPPARSPRSARPRAARPPSTNSTCAISGGIEVTLPIPTPNSSTPSSSSGTLLPAAAISTARPRSAPHS